MTTVIPNMRTSKQYAALTLNPTAQDPSQPDNPDARISVAVDGAPQWNLKSGDDKVVLIPSEDGLSCQVRPKGDLIEGPYEVDATADALRGEGVVPVTTSFVGTVADPMADDLGASVQIIDEV